VLKLIKIKVINLKKMRQVIYIQEPECRKEKLVLTHRKGSSGWEKVENTSFLFSNVSKIVYLGHCRQDGDMFAVNTTTGYIIIYKGYLNSGKY
jgi:hypothetical protein